MRTDTVYNYGQHMYRVVTVKKLGYLLFQLSYSKRGCNGTLGNPRPDLPNAESWRTDPVLLPSRAAVHTRARELLPIRPRPSTQT